MRVLLVRPPVPPHTMGLKHVMICEPLELEYVAAGLDGHEVEILDLIVEEVLGGIVPAGYDRSSRSRPSSTVVNPHSRYSRRLTTVPGS